MLKIVGLLLFSISIGSVGFIMSEKLKFRKKYLQEFEQFCVSCIEEMRYKKNIVFDIFSNVQYKDLVFLNQINRNNITNERELIRIIRKANFCEADAEVIFSFISKLGDGDLESQKAHCGYYAEKFHMMLSEAANDFNEKGRLFKSLSISAAVALFIIMI